MSRPDPARRPDPTENGNFTGLRSRPVAPMRERHPVLICHAFAVTFNNIAASVPTSAASIVPTSVAAIDQTSAIPTVPQTQKKTLI